ncbi:MAG TPA: peroxiredoxin [Firmicutes bacterium]|nr:peroxiredoxin [Bacillota bacterium]
MLLQPGQPAPRFTADAVWKKERVRLSLDSYEGLWVILFFFPSGFTFICPTELGALALLHSVLTERNARIIAISTDSAFAHKMAGLHSPNAQLVRFPLVADRQGKIAKLYGVYSKNGGFAYRGVFFIDPELRIRTFMVYDNSIGRGTHEILRVLEALQYADESGRAVQADWYPGYMGLLPQWPDAGKY